MQALTTNATLAIAHHALAKWKLADVVCPCFPESDIPTWARTMLTAIAASVPQVIATAKAASISHFGTTIRS
jgi:hypothetical protein